MRADLVPGAQFPDIRLPDWQGKLQSLSEIQGEDPLVVVFYRGLFWPKDQRQLQGLVGLEAEMDVAYTKAVAISVDPPYVCGEMRAGLHAHFPFLSDQARRWQKELDLQEYTDPTHDPFIPTTFVLEPGLIIYKIYNGYWFWGRPRQEDLRQDFRAISQRCRPDWDAQAPGVREAWEEARGQKRRLTGVEFSRLIQAKRQQLGV